MHSIIFYIVFCSLLYVILLAFIFLRNSYPGRKNDGDGDDDGGLPMTTPPHIDLPPGVTWPDDIPRKAREPEESLV